MSALGLIFNVIALICGIVLIISGGFKEDQEVGVCLMIIGSVFVITNLISIALNLGITP